MSHITGIETIQLLIPEFVLLASAAYIYLAGTFVSNRWWWTLFGLAAFGIAGWSMWRQEAGLVESFLQPGVPAAVGPLLVDWLGEGVRNLGWFSGLILLLASHGSARRGLSAEFAGTLMVATVGLMVVGRANDLVLLFLGLELISIPTYILLFLSGRGRSGMEAAIKYFFLSLLSSALLLYGFSMLYGLAGTTTLVEPVAGQGVVSVFSGAPAPLVLFALTLVLAGIGFKLTMFPFHFYAPDVYEGSGWVGAGFLATVPKIAGVVVLFRLLGYHVPTPSPVVWQLVAVLAVVTMTFGNTCALWQTNVRRLLAYSSIAHAGYMLVGLTVALAVGRSLEFGGLAAMFFYGAVYLPASLATFAGMLAADRGGARRESIGDLAGLGRERPVLAGLIAVGVFSLAGIPPLAGFWGKLGLFSSLIGTTMGWLEGAKAAPADPWLAALLVITAINAAIGAAYYLRLLGGIYFAGRAAHPSERVERAGVFPMAATLLAGWIVILIGLMPGALLESAGRAEQMLVPAHTAQSPDHSLRSRAEPIDDQAE